VMVVKTDSTVEERKIETGVRQGDDVQITSGVKPGEAVVTVGGIGLEDKAKVQVQNADKHE
jgi:multidrug efflux pump subunit AcrA (membrane-fusion protein)